MAPDYESTDFAFHVDGAEPGHRLVIRGDKGARVVPTESPLAPEIADLMSRVNDLKKCIKYCELHLGLRDDPNVPQELKDAVGEAALMSYGRAFSNDQRKAGALDLGVLDALEGDPHAVHQHFMQLRNKYLAHSDNAYEDALVGFSLAEYPDGRSITGVHTVLLTTNDFRGAEDLTILAQTLARGADVSLHDLKARLLREGQQLDVATAYDRQDLSYTIPSPEDAGIRRRRPGQIP
jgi:hypothetical protein